MTRPPRTILNENIAIGSSTSSPCMDIFENFSKILKKHCDKGSSCVIAVSGGADSMSLLRLITAFNDKTHTFHNMVAVTVDHGLRSDSLSEALQVARWCKNLNVEHRIETWKGEKPKTGLQKHARQARYQALLNVCQSKGARYLFTAHHHDDQLETFFLRLFKGSGVQGLGCMHISQPIEIEVSTDDSESSLNSSKKKNAVILLRPLISLSKTSLEQYLRNIQQDFIHDPSNQNDDFERVKLRRMIQNLREKNFDVDAISKTIIHIQEVSAFIERSLEKKQIIDAHGGDLSSYRFDVTSFQSLDPFLQQTFLRDFLWKVSTKDYPPKFKNIEKILKNIQLNVNFTHSGYLWHFSKGFYTLTPEKRSTQKKFFNS